MTEKIKTLHPQGKSGVSINKEKYDAVYATILEAIRDQGDITFAELTEAVGNKLEGNFDGSIGWYVTTVKLDMEARNVIERIPKQQPTTLTNCLTQPSNQDRVESPHDRLVDGSLSLDPKHIEMISPD